MWTPDKAVGRLGQGFGFGGRSGHHLPKFGHCVMHFAIGGENIRPTPKAATCGSSWDGTQTNPTSTGPTASTPTHCKCASCDLFLSVPSVIQLCFLPPTFGLSDSMPCPCLRTFSGNENRLCGDVGIIKEKVVLCPRGFPSM